MNKLEESDILQILGICMIIIACILLYNNSCYYDSITASLVFLIGGIGLFVKSFFIDE